MKFVEIIRLKQFKFNTIYIKKIRRPRKKIQLIVDERRKIPLNLFVARVQVHKTVGMQFLISVLLMSVPTVDSRWEKISIY